MPPVKGDRRSQDRAPPPKSERRSQDRASSSEKLVNGSGGGQVKVNGQDHVDSVERSGEDPVTAGYLGRGTASSGRSESKENLNPSQPAAAGEPDQHKATSKPR